MRTLKSNYFFFLLAYSIIQLNTYGQNRISKKLSEIKDSLQTGIYERTINNGYVKSLEQYEKRVKPDFLPFNRLTYNFLRFDFKNEVKSDSQYNYVVGKVFMSERYYEEDYYKVFSNTNAFKNDVNGFFMKCKLYYDDISREIRLNIYPNYITNICKKKMHKNTSVCKNSVEHDEALNEIVKLRDGNYRDFLLENDYETEIKAFKENIRVNKTNIELKEKKDLLREINLDKQIKIFSLGSTDNNIQNLISNLTLEFTKYSLSEDLLEGNEYKYNRITYEDYKSLFDKINDYRNKIGSSDTIIISKNKAYFSLMQSDEPDDVFFLELTINSISSIIYFSNFQDIRKLVSDEQTLKNLTNTKSKLEKSIDKLSKEIDTHISELNNKNIQIDEKSADLLKLKKEIGIADYTEIEIKNVINLLNNIMTKTNLDKLENIKTEKDLLNTVLSAIYNVNDLEKKVKNININIATSENKKKNEEKNLSTIDSSINSLKKSIDSLSFVNISLNPNLKDKPDLFVYCGTSKKNSLDEFSNGFYVRNSTPTLNKETNYYNRGLILGYYKYKENGRVNQRIKVNNVYYKLSNDFKELIKDNKFYYWCKLEKDENNVKNK